MPLITWAYLGFVAGLLAGFSHVVWLTASGMAILLCAASVARSSASLGMLMLFIAGLTFAASAPLPHAGYRGSATAHPDTWLDHQRSRADSAITTVFRRDAPLVKALLVADKTELSKEQKDQYAAAGMVHMLSMSGLHVAIIATAIELGVRLLRLPRRAGAVASVVIVVLYIAIIGFPLAALRSGVMLIVTSLSRMSQRPTSRWATLAIAAFVPLVDPRTVLNAGYQLGVSGTAAIIASGGLARRVIKPRFKGWRGMLLWGLLTSTVATAVTAPLAACAFGQISLVGPVTNMFAGPLLGLIQPMLLLAVLLSPIPAIATFLADATHPLLMAFDSVARYGAAIPYGAVRLHPTLTVAVLGGIVSVAIVTACVSRFPARAMVIGCGAVCALIWSSSSSG